MLQLGVLRTFQFSNPMAYVVSMANGLLHSQDPSEAVVPDFLDL